MTQVIEEVTLTNPIIEKDPQGNDVPNQTMRLFISQVVENSLIIGTGSPEGVVEANQGREYMDDAGTAGNIKYIKRDASDGAGDLSIGWILV